MGKYILNPNTSYWIEFYDKQNKKYENYIRVYCPTTLYPKKLNINYIGITLGGQHILLKSHPSFERPYESDLVD